MERLLWNWVLLVRKVAGIPRVYELVVIVFVGWFVVSLYDSDSENRGSSLARMCIQRLNRWSLFFCSGINPSLGVYYTIPLLDTSYKSDCLVLELVYVWYIFPASWIHAAAAYSRIEAERFVGKQCGIGRSPIQYYLDIPSCWFAVMTFLWLWAVNFISDWTMTPRYFTSCTISS